MLSISNPLSVAKTQTYYSTDYSVGTNYFSQSSTLKGEWYGSIATTFGLEGQQVKDEHFQRVAEGKHPITGEILVRARDTVKTRAGEEKDKISAWDLCFSAGKSVSVTSLVDSRIIDAHRSAVRAALHEAEQLIQARGGGNKSAVTTGRMLVAVFDHNTSRPVSGYAAIQVHSHAVVANMTESENGQARSINPHELFVAKSYLGATYQNNLEISLRKMGYETFLGKGSTVEIAGYTKDYLESESKRTKQIEDAAKELGLTGAKAKALLAHSTRSEKLTLTPEEIRAAHLKNAAEYGNQPRRVAQAASERKSVHVEIPSVAKTAVDFAREKLSERSAVFDHHQILYEALKHARGRVGLEAIKAEVDRQKAEGRLITVDHVRPHAPLYRYTTPELIADERAVIERVLSAPDRRPICLITDESIAGKYPLFNEWQRRIVKEQLESPKQTTIVQGSAGTGKTEVTKAMQAEAAKEGIVSYGFGPTSMSVRALREAGIKNSETLQKFLMPHRMAEHAKDPGHKRLFFVDEASLAAARQMRRFMACIHPSDRVIIIGDVRQNNSLEAGRILLELQQAGAQVSRINKLVRQQSPEMKALVEAMARGKTVDAVAMLSAQGRLESIQHRGDRFKAIGREYARMADGESKLAVVTPDNVSRQELNTAVRHEMQAQGKLGKNVFRTTILVPRQELTGPDKAVAEAYAAGDVIQYRGGSNKIGIKSGAYATVLESDREKNEIKVKTADGKVKIYNPELLSKVSVYSPELRHIAVGERLQMTSPNRKLGLVNRETGTVLEIDRNGNARLQMDSGHKVGINLKQSPHIEYSYAGTSHSLQGATLDRGIIHLDTGDTRIGSLVTQQLGYVGVSRFRYDVKVFTDDGARLGEALQRQQQKHMALSPEEINSYKKTGLAA